MSIRYAHAIPYSLPLKSPFKTAKLTVTERRGWIIQLEDDEGLIGQGECAPLPGWSTDDVNDYAGSLPHFLDTFDFAAFDYSATAATAFDSVDAIAQPALRFALESALLDYVGQKQGLPLARLLNPASADKVAVNAIIPIRSIDETVQEAVASIDAGIKTIKMKVHDRNDISRIGAVRDAVGGAINIRLDANGAWDSDTAIDILRELEPYDIEFVEQPVPDEDIGGMAKVKAGTSIPIAADESVTNQAAFQTIISQNAANVIVLKPTVNGGLLNCLKMARSAQAAGMRVVVTTALESVVGRTAALHLAAACGSPDLAHGLGTGSLLASDLGPEPTPIASGMMKLATGSGLGLKAIVKPS